MLKRFLVIFFALFLFLGWVSTPAEALTIYQFPGLNETDGAFVIDQGGALSRLNEGKLNKELKAVAQRTGTEVRFVTTRLEYGDTIEKFTQQLFKKWFPTVEAQGKQILLVLDTFTTAGAIQVGPEVTEALTDDIAQSIASETLMAPIREGTKYNEGFLNASDRLAAVLSGQPDPGAPELANNINIEATFTNAEETDDKSATVWVIVLLVVATIVPMVTYFMYVGFPGQ